jgi:beta-galactosidase
LEHARPLAYYDHPFFGRWPAITENQFGSGTLTYEGTYLSDPLQQRVLDGLVRTVGLTSAGDELPRSIRTRAGVNATGKHIRYYFNYSSEPQEFPYRHAAGVDLLTEKPVANAQQIQLAPWDLAIIEEQ